jgi:protein tyrosine/serine phosphatase
LLLVIGAVVLWEEYLEYRLFPKRFGVVEQGSIYRSGELHPALVERVLRDHHIKVIVAMLNERSDHAGDAAERDAAEKLGIDIYRYPLAGDGSGKIEHYADAVERMVLATEQHQPVLVHCAAGAQRTGGVVAFYRLLVQHHDPADVIAEMEQYDWDDHDNPVLVDYLNDHMAEMAQLLVDRGVIDQAPDPLPRLTP